MSDINNWYIYVEMTHRYAFGLDVDNGRGVAEMFTADGIWDASDLGYGYLEGHSELQGYFEVDEGRPEAMAHIFSNHQVLEATGSSMRARAYVHGIVVRGGKDVLRHDLVRYDDQLVRVDGEWKFARRTLKRVLEYRTTRPMR